MIPEAAVEALANVLAQEALIEADMAGAGWDAENDSPEPFMPRARERAQAYLEAAAPHMLADYLLSLAADTRARGDVGKEEEGGIEAWTYLEWKAEQIRPTP